MCVVPPGPSSSSRALASSRVLAFVAVLAVASLIAPSVGAKPVRGHAPVELLAQAARAPQGLGPGAISSLYSLPARGAKGQTVAIISAYDDPRLENDLAAYSKRFRLAPCTRKNGCLRKVNQAGTASPLPSPDYTGGAWLTESSLGVEVAHGVCQSCRIMLVEANSIGEFDIADSVRTAARLGATVIATAFIAPGSYGEQGLQDAFSQPHAPVVAAAGDTGYTGAANFPADLPNVLAVGGTKVLYNRGGHPTGETAWSGTTSGCSLYEPPAPWQAKIAKAAGCGNSRAVSDLAAVSEPGAIVYISGAPQPGGPWYVASGTSLSVPVIAAVIGLAGSAGSGEANMLYSRAQGDRGILHDIRTGTSAAGCQVIICKAGLGWDGPTGFGTPYGLEAFLPHSAALSRKRPNLQIPVSRGALRASSRWGVRLRLVNGNAFRVSGRIILRRTVKIGRETRTSVLASTTVRIGPLASGNPLLTILPRYRALLRRLGATVVFAELDARASGGPAVKVSARLSLRSP